MSKTLTLPQNVAGHLSGARARLQHRSRWIRQRIVPPEVGVIGGYHYGNLGDIALGLSVQEEVRRFGARSALQTIYNLDHWPAAPVGIVGGGAVAYMGPLDALSRRYGSRPQSLSFAGVDFNDPNALRKHRAFLQEVNRITCRSEEQAELVRSALGRPDVVAAPDLVFTLLQAEFGRLRAARGQGGASSAKLLAINLVPLMASVVRRQLVPSEHMQRERPSMVAQFELLHERYVALARQVCSDHIRQGWRVVHLPFTPTDDTYARYALAGLPVSFDSYRSTPESVISRLKLAGRFFTTRFHALILGVRAGVPLIPFAYASKNERLLASLGDGVMLTPERLIDAPRLCWEETLRTVPFEQVERIEAEAATALHELVRRTLSDRA